MLDNLRKPLDKDVNTGFTATSSIRAFTPVQWLSTTVSIEDRHACGIVGVVPGFEASRLLASEVSARYDASTSHWLNDASLFLADRAWV